MVGKNTKEGWSQTREKLKESVSNKKVDKHNFLMSPSFVDETLTSVHL